MRPDEHGREGLRHHGMTRQVRPGNEGPRARYPRPDALLTTEDLALGEHRIRTGDGPGHGTHSHLPPPPPERVEGQNSTYSRCTVEDISSTPIRAGCVGPAMGDRPAVAPAGGVVEQDQATGEESAGLEDDIRPDSLFSRFPRPARTRWPAPASSPGPGPRILQRCLRLFQPETHVHLAVHRNRSRQVILSLGVVASAPE